MRKIPTLFKRDMGAQPRHVYDEVMEGCEWVVRGEGIATRKWDGTCCLYEDGKLYKRYLVRPGKEAPPDFRPAQDEVTETGKLPGWVPVGDGPEDQWHREGLEALKAMYAVSALCGTYELVGPKVQGNPENRERHILIGHGRHSIRSVPVTFSDLQEWLRRVDIEGIVWWHEDGRKAKIKKKDFGLPRIPEAPGVPQTPEDA